MSSLTSRLANLNVFSESGNVDDEDRGEAIDHGSSAGGGRPSQVAIIPKDQLSVSHALRSYLVHEQVLSQQEAEPESGRINEAVRKLLSKPHINIPSALTDRSHPLSEYFISSSHNTYLTGDQLYGTTSASAYEVALTTGSRCVEIDAWDNDDDRDEPKVTHGYTLVSHVPFRSVCETIRDVVDKEATHSVDKQGYAAAPIMLSLENHCGDYGQMRLVNIMREVWGHRLLSKAVRHEGTREQEGSGEKVTLHELRSKIAIIVEYHIQGEAEESDPESFSENEEEKRAYEEYVRKKKAACSMIIPELAELGVYAQSVKPTNNSWFDPGVLINGPHDHLINVSESGLSAHLPTHAAAISMHNAEHLVRVYPKGTRISSSNLKPVPFWGVGTQICALNWQEFGTSNQLNRAMFSGTDGYVLKPAALRAGGNGKLGTGKMKRLRLRVGGASDIPLRGSEEADKIRPYLTCSLFHPNDLKNEPPKRKTVPYKHHKLGFLHHGENSAPTDPIWDETLEWEFEENELVFVRMLIKSDDSWAKNPIFTTAAVRLSYVVPGWSFIQMHDLKGKDTKCTILVEFEIEDA